MARTMDNSFLDLNSLQTRVRDLHSKFVGWDVYIQSKYSYEEYISIQNLLAVQYNQWKGTESNKSIYRQDLQLDTTGKLQEEASVGWSYMKQTRILSKSNPRLV